MADAPLIVTDADGNAPAIGQLFKGINFFLSQRLPTRSKFIADVEANGGRVVKLEKNSDFVIADHMRKPTPAGSFSYTLIEQAIRDGVFPNPADHALGPTADSPRAVGSQVPGKRTRTAFTAEDDLYLWEWVEYEKTQAQSVKGNEIYKRLEAANPRHTWQAWRDHYVKKLMDNPPFGAMGMEASPTGSEEELPETTRPQSASKKRRSKQPVELDADKSDFDMLWEQAQDIENMDETMYEDAWGLWAQVNNQHTATEWRHIWESDVRPFYRKQRTKAKTKRRHASISGDDNDSQTGTHARKKGKGRAMAPKDNDVECVSRGDAETGRTDQQQARDVSPVADESMEQIAGVESLGDDRTLEDPDDDLAALETWQGVNRRKPSPKHRLVESDAPTSEVNRAVGDQVQTEMDDGTSGEKGHSSEQFLTSDINRAADLQIRKEANRPEPRQHMSAESADEPEAGGGTQNGLQAWYAERVDELNGIAKSAESGNDVEDSDSRVHSLTEANLVSQQAAHADPVTRGIDLPQDDQNKDQTEYVKFLQNVTGQPQEQNANSNSDLPSPARPVRAASKVPVSSQHEVDKAMKDALDWPSSPQHTESQEQEFETQLPQARLPVSKDHLRSLMPDFELSSQSLMSQTNNESLASQGEYDVGNRSTHQDDQMAQPDIFEGLDDINDTHIELSIPEPEGEFTFTSSPNRSQPAASKNRLVKQGSGGVAELQEPAHKAGQSRNVVVDISSDASSSSLPSSQLQDVSRLQTNGKHAVETQDILNAETQRPDFFMPLPDDEQGQPHAKKGQSDKNLQDQVPDLSMPLPPDWEAEVDGRESSSSKVPTRQPKQKQKQKIVESQTMDVERELESWLDTQQVRGFNETSAIAAMQRSSMRPDLAELILRAEKGGLGFPSDVPGIWSEREDTVLESGDSGALRRLEAKHGWDECDARMRFLAEWREA